jgi:hypothetical protein
MTDTDSYIALRRGEVPGEFEAVLVPAGLSPRDRVEHATRTIRSRVELDDLRTEWAVDDVRGEDPATLDR